MESSSLRELIRSLRWAIRAAEVQIHDYWALRWRQDQAPLMVTHTFCRGFVLVDLFVENASGSLTGRRLIVDRNGNLHLQRRLGERNSQPGQWSYWTAGFASSDGPMPHPSKTAGKHYYTKRISPWDALQVKAWTPDDIKAGLQRMVESARDRTVERLCLLSAVRKQLERDEIEALIDDFHRRTSPEARHLACTDSTNRRNR